MGDEVITIGQLNCWKGLALQCLTHRGLNLLLLSSNTLFMQPSGRATVCGRAHLCYPCNTKTHNKPNGQKTFIAYAARRWRT
eukprot:3563005-Amphidinium_carterae.2